MAINMTQMCKIGRFITVPLVVAVQARHLLDTVAGGSGTGSRQHAGAAGRGAMACAGLPPPARTPSGTTRGEAG
jgi:hypothetical protein